MSKDYHKEKYQEKMRAYLDALRAELDEIESYMEQSAADEDAVQKLDEARDVDNRAHDHLHEVEKTDHLTWEERRVRVEAVWDELMLAIVELEKRIEPETDANSRTAQ